MFDDRWLMAEDHYRANTLQTTNESKTKIFVEIDLVGIVIIIALTN